MSKQKNNRVTERSEVVKFIQITTESGLGVGRRYIIPVNQIIDIVEGVSGTIQHRTAIHTKDNDTLYPTESYNEIINIMLSLACVLNPE